MVSEPGVGFAVLAAVGLAGQSIAVRLATREETPLTVLYYVMVLNIVVLVPLTLAVTTDYDPTPRSVAFFATAGVMVTLSG